MVLFVVESHNLLGDVRLERVVRIGEVWELKRGSETIGESESLSTHRSSHDGDGSVVAAAACERILYLIIIASPAE